MSLFLPCGVGSAEAAGDVILRPLVGFDKLEIVNEARRIGSYDLSIQPHDDCCSYLMPPNPATSSSDQECARVERELDVERLVTEAVERAEIRTVESL